MKKWFTVENISRQGIIASLYFVLTFASSGLSFGDIQFRISEALVLIIFFRKENALGICIGCFLTNAILSPIILFDITLGFLQTVIYALLIMRSRFLIEAAIYPIITMPITALAIFYGFKLEVPFIAVMLSTMASEAIVMIFGIIIFNKIEHSPFILKAIGAKQNISPIYINFGGKNEF